MNVRRGRRPSEHPADKLRRRSDAGRGVGTVPNADGCLRLVRALPLAMHGNGIESSRSGHEFAQRIQKWELMREPHDGKEARRAAASDELGRTIFSSGPAAHRRMPEQFAERGVHDLAKEQGVNNVSCDS